MLDKIKGIVSRERVIDRATLNKHGNILKEMDRQKTVAQLTLEESFRVRGFPIGRIVRDGAHQR